MAKISDFNAYFTRKYMKGGVIGTDDPIECAQLYYDSVNSSNNTYFRYQENAPTINFTTAGGPPYQNSYYAAYNPGLVYLPERYYTYDDLFPNGLYDDFSDSFVDPEEFVSEALTRNWQFDAATGANLPYRRSIINPKDRFYYDEDGNTWISQISINISDGRSYPTGIYRSVSLLCHMLKFRSDLNPNSFVFGDTKGINYRGTSTQWVVPQSNGTYKWLHDVDRYSNGYYNVNVISSLCFGYTLTGERVPLSKAQDRVKKFFEILKKERIYPVTNNLRYDNTMELYITDNLPQYGQVYPKIGSFLVDLSLAPHYPTAGFFIQIVISNDDKEDLFRLEWTGKGPDANNPDITDDPNDKDPGIGPGQDPNDEGGDGDHDNTSDDIKPPGIPTLSASGAGLIAIYNPSQSQLEALARSMWTPTALQAIKQYFTNPMDTILGLSMIPVQPKTASSREIMLGLYETGVTAPLVDSDYVIVNCGSIMINRYYGSYLDYSPYTKIKCYLPYIGEVDVNPDEVMTTSLMVLYYVNVVTGDVVAMICSDENILYTAAGNCIRQLPLSSADYASIINTAVSAVSGIAMAVATGGVSSAGVAAAGAAKAATDETKKLASARATANNVGSANNLVGDVMNAKLNYKHAGSIGTGSGQLSYQKPYLIIERPNLDLASNYKSFVGYPCNKTLQIGRCSGFTQIEASNLSVPNATDEEIAEIKELLLGGVII